MSIDLDKLIKLIDAEREGDPDVDRVLNSLANRLRDADANDYLGTLYRTDFKVTGRGAFPVDMLRYTAAFPKGEEDARAIENSFDRDGVTTITLTKYHRDPTPVLSEARWLSKFRWQVVEGSVETNAS